MEDLAGIAIVIAILISGVVVGYESLSRLFAPRPVEHLWAVVIASVIGFLGNEAVAVFRIKVGNEIGSAALVAEGSMLGQMLWAVWPSWSGHSACGWASPWLTRSLVFS